MRNKKVKIFVTILLLIIFSVNVVLAVFPALAGIALATTLRTVGGIVIAHVIRHQVAYTLLGGLLSGLGYITYDRGTAVAPAKRYVNVPLAASAAKVNELKPSASSVIWASGLATSKFGLSDEQYNLGWRRFKPSPDNSMWVYVENDSTCGSLCQDGFSEGQNLSVATGVADLRVWENGQLTGLRYGVAPSWYQLKYANEIAQAKIYTNDDLRKRYQRALGLDLSQSGLAASAAPASNTRIYHMGGDVYETNNYTDARSYVENSLASDTPAEDAAEKTVPPVSDGFCGDYQYKNDWATIKTKISTAVAALPLYGLINKLADLTGQSGFPHQYTLDLSSVHLGSPTLDLDQWYILDVLAVMRWAILAGSFILAWKIAVGGDD